MLRSDRSHIRNAALAVLALAAASFAPAAIATAQAATMPQMQASFAETRAQGRAALLSRMIAEIGARPDEASAILDAAIAASPADENILRATASAAFPQTEFAAAPQPAAETAAKEEKPRIFTGEVAAGANVTSGNTDSTAASLSTALQWDFGKWEVESNGSLEYASDGDTKTTQRYYLDSTVRRDLNERLYAFGFASYTDDQFSGYKYETAGNAGLGYRIYTGKVFKLDVEAGPGYRYSELTNGGVETEPTARIASGLVWNLNDNAKLTNDIAVNVGTDKTISTDTLALTTKLIGALAARASVELRHNSAPPAGSEELDTTSKLSLVYSLN
ncbi:DUF481 domain-containing protein [Parvibaculum sp.]|uniref:DUF481 domain-containing protein n=1 Tax=Parvibaculum sp. TaxID=2024848 RepID=UPI00260000DF|nr:DUF481 domain-containing protein [Parvibaculum sp.]